MSFTQLSKQLRLGIALLAGGGAFALAGPAAAQGAFGVPDPGSALSMHLKTLSDSPRNLSALTGAARAALALGDPQAAVTFFARAEEIAPRDGRIKAGIGSAFLAMEQAGSALRFFEEARALGAPEGEYASDRGLAYDLTGNPAQAQRDYQLAMRTHDGDEVRRRLALSRAITGDRAGALAVIDDQVRRQDRAGWRVRAFVLALTGDASGATETARAMMPQQAAAMQPFFARLPGLRPAERAMAVHFGHFPGDGQGTPMTSQPTYAGVSPSLPPAITDAGRPGGAPFARSSGPSLASTQPATSGAGPRRAISGPAQGKSQPVQTVKSGSGQRSAAEPNVLRERWSDARGGSRNRSSGQPVKVARADTRSPASRPAPAPTNMSGQSRGTGSMAQDRMARMAERQPRVASPSAKPAASQGQRAAGSAGTDAQLAMNLARLPGTVTAMASPSVSVPRATAPEGKPAEPRAFVGQPSPAVLTEAKPVQGPPSPSGTPPGLISAAPPSGSRPSSVTAPPVQIASRADTPPVSSGSTSPVVPGASEPVATPIVQSVTPPASAQAQAEALAKIVPASPPTEGLGLSASLASVAATIRALDVEAPKEPAPAPVTPVIAKAVPKSVETETKSEAQPAKPVIAKAEPKSVKTETKSEAQPSKGEAKAQSVPSRHWVQIAGSADKGTLKGEFARLKAKAPKLLGDKTPWTAPLRFTNRLLVGPFESEKDAQALVNELSKAELASFSWTSPAGEQVEKLPSR